ncbi:hypothetical protein [Corynebacterium pacaense]|uniref:hypothetical protein n=1 Tax=Corynebacterium pacaense TaxID=1816684 RepID=UPI0009BAB2AF|nr:hypothetical protein [Corynebacterium pacaense]
MITHRNPFRPQPSSTDYAEHLHEVFPTVLSDVGSMMRHPRSLARPIPTWRPPRIQLPPLPGTDPLSLTLSRHCVGRETRDLLTASGGEGEPAYLITVRLSNADGYRVSAPLAEGWVRALLTGQNITSVHELRDEATPTFCWLVDSHFLPVPSPASLFQGRARAA